MTNYDFRDAGIANRRRLQGERLAREAASLIHKVRFAGVFCEAPSLVSKDQPAGKLKALETKEG